MARGHIRKRGDTWAVVIELPSDPLTKKRRQKWHSGIRTKKEAEALLTRLLREQDTGLAIATTTQSLAAYLADWVAKRLASGKIRDSTAQMYGYAIRARIAPSIGALPLAAITPAHIDAWLGALRADGLSERRVRGIYTIVHGGLRAAVKLRLLAINPCDAVDSPSPEDKDRLVWDEAQTRRFRALIAGDPLESLYLLVLGTGLRAGEVLGLRWEDVDLGRGTLAVRRQQSRTGSGTAFAPPKTRSGLRSLRVPAFALAALLAERGRSPGDGPIFRDALGRGLALHQLDHRWGRLARRFPPDLPRITFHDLRHVHATHALLAGVAPKVLSQRLGHSSIRITMDRYVHVTDALDAAAADQIDRLWEGDTPPPDTSGEGGL